MVRKSSEFQLQLPPLQKNKQLSNYNKYNESTIH